MRGAFFLVWLLGVPIGVLLRAWFFADRGITLLAISPTFLILSLIFIGLFTGLPRLLWSGLACAASGSSKPRVRRR
jgi:hypothetical protein